VNGEEVGQCLDMGGLQCLHKVTATIALEFVPAR
jgi:hypothetical protein